MDLPGAAILGAGAGSKHVVGVNCEMMPNMRIAGKLPTVSARHVINVGKLK